MDKAKEMIDRHIFFNARDIVRDDVYEELSPDQLEDILQWWAVSQFLGEKLREEGEAIVFYEDFCLWGRTTAGQAIEMDAVVQRIADGYFNV